MILFDFFKSIRFGNISILAIAQYFVVMKDVTYFNFSLQLELILFTSLAMALGNLENNIIDHDMDTKCKGRKPNKVVLFFHNTSWIWVLDFIFIITLCFTISDSRKWIGMAAWLILKSYNYYFKRKILIGNLLVAALCSAALLVMDRSSYLWDYAIIIFLLTLLREWIKDKEDSQCDIQYGFQTIGTVLSIRCFRNICFLLGVVCYIFTVFFLQNSWEIILFFHAGFIGLLVMIYIQKWTISSYLIKGLILLGIYSILDYNIF